ncbi:reverse transcriptase domain-containing protein [Tanacetum coccineum]
MGPLSHQKPISDEALREYCDGNYHQILPIIAEKVHQEKAQQEKLKAVKAHLNFEETSHHSESGTPIRIRGPKERLGSRYVCSRSGSPELRRGRSESPKKKGSERKIVFKRLENGVFHGLGDKGKSVSVYSDDSRRRSYHSSHRDTESCHQSSRSRTTEPASERRYNKRASSRRTEELSESKGSAKGHWKFDATNNEAEYEALIAGLKIAEQMGVKNLQANVDSRLVVNQVNGTYVAKETDIIRYLEKDARKLIRACQDCQVRKPVPRSPQQKLSPITSPWPFYKWGIDIAGPFPEGPGKVKFLIVAIDYFTKWIEAKLVATITGNQIKKIVWDNIVCRFGLPGEIISDNGKQFQDNLFKDCARNYVSANILLLSNIHKPMA